MNSVVHILNGDSMTHTLQKSGLQGDRIVWREMLCDGPLTKDVGSDDFWMQRYKFFEEELKVDKLEYYDKTIKELIAIEDLSNYKEVVLWFEYDLFCQINLLALCSYLLKHFRKDIFYYLICVGEEKGRDGWQTLADYVPEEYKELYENKMKLSRNDLVYANECWNVYVDANIEDLKSFDFNKNRKFKYLNSAMNQHLKNSNETRGLDQIAHKILQVVGNGVLNKNDIIRQLLLWQRKETVNGFGDMQYEIRLNYLKDYCDIKNNMYSLNTKGQELLT